jgi:biotin transport system ATP-binding protein
MATHELSEGQKQLVCLLTVLMDAPDVLLLDEPFTSLDHRHTRSLMKTIMSLPQRVIMSTHRMDLVQDFDEVIWLDQGAVGLQGPPGPVIQAYLREAG